MPRMRISDWWRGSRWPCSSSPYGGGRRVVNALGAGALVAALVFCILPGGAAASAAAPRILVLGDSLTAGYGLPQADAFPARLQKALNDAGIKATVINGGVSGDTSAGGLSRLEWVLSDEPDAVIVELGANDGLRGIDPLATEANLDAILARLDDAGIPVLLAGMKAPPNLGRAYGTEFEGIYKRLAKLHDVVFYPFFLDGVAADPALNQDDGIHPNKRGVAVIVKRILPAVKKLIARIR